MKALRAEADDLRKKISSHKTRLACVQGRRQKELETANKKIEVCVAPASLPTVQGTIFFVSAKSGVIRLTY